MRSHRPLAMILGLAFTLPLRAQPGPVAVPGDSVHVTARTLGMYERPGTLEWAFGDSISFRDATTAGTLVTVALAQIDHLEVNFGNEPPRHAAGKGMLFGTLFGAVGGAIVGTATYRPPPSCSPSEWFCDLFYPTQGEQTVAYAVAGAIVGLAAGGILGATVFHRSSYRDVKPSALGTVASALSGQGVVAVEPMFDPHARTGGLVVAVKF
jgi:outer membrane lipoprotein SlyB